jgi:ribosomal protein S18 acetylase RimI-like enzyme
MMASSAEYRQKLFSQSYSQTWPRGYPQGWMTQPLLPGEISEAVELDRDNLEDFGFQPAEVKTFSDVDVLRYDETYFRRPGAVNRCVRLGDGALAGFSCAVPVDETTIDLYNILVGRPYRRLGIARTLLDDFVGFAKLHGYSRATLSTGSHNIAANATYQRFGFQEYQRDLDARAPGVDTVRYVIEIS